jgi:hypothetical protein
MSDLNQKLQLSLMEFLPANKTFGFLISGGLDSALLLYAALTLKTKLKLPGTYSVFTVPRYDDSVVHSCRILNWLNDKFHSKLELIVVGNPDEHHSRQVLSGIHEAGAQCNLVILGDTQNPPHLSNGPLRSKGTSPRLIQPFFTWTKKDTVRLAIELNLTELMELTHTCTESKTLRCNNCWQCKERAWGFSENNFIDPGTM